MPITFSSPRAQTEVVYFFLYQMKAHIFLIANLKFQLQILCSFGDIIKIVKLNGIPENNFLCIFIIASSLVLFPQEGKQEATSGWNFTKCISEVKVNQLKVRNMHVKMGISTFKYCSILMNDSSRKRESSYCCSIVRLSEVIFILLSK